MTNRRLFAKAVLILACSCLPVLGCATRPTLRAPFLVLHFRDVDLVIEKAPLLEKAISTEDGNLQFKRISRSAHFEVEGSGRFTVRGRTFRYDGSSLECECEGFNKSLGAVLVRADGALVSVNLLPLLAD